VNSRFYIYLLAVGLVSIAPTRLRAAAPDGQPGISTEVAGASLQLANPSAAFIQRTMKQLSDSTPEHPARVRVLFYGQSITAQPWTSAVKKELQQRFPSVQFEFHNPAIGGFTSPSLVRTAEPDLYPWYPDLLIFHVYGPMEPYEEIIRKTRERTCAEIILHTDHISTQPQANQEESDRRVGQMADIARRYDCMLIDVRAKWIRYLSENGKEAQSLLRDTIHLNEAGCALLAKCVNEELLRLPQMGDGAASAGQVTRIGLDSPAVTRTPDGALTLRFSGNRVDAITDGSSSGGALELILDGKPAAEHREIWAAARTSTLGAGFPAPWFPAIKCVQFEQAPLAETWTLTCLEDSTPDGGRAFKVEGSVTGEDGTGRVSQRFVSQSGRVVIEPGDWSSKGVASGFKTTWKTYPCHAGTLPALKAGESAVLLQGAVNGEHTLTVSPGSGISGFRIYHPASAGMGKEIKKTASLISGAKQKE
jgi:hypothetical protein